MPTSVIAAVAAYGASTVVGGGILGALAGALVSNLVTSIFAGSSKPQQGPTFAQDLSDRALTVRQPVAPWQWIYGQARVGGVITYIESTNSGGNLHLVVTLAGHVSQEIGDIYLNDELVPLDGSGNATGKFGGYVRILKSLGDEAGQPFPLLVSESAGLWTDAHRQTGRTKLYVRLQFNSSLFPSGIPNITAVVKGRKVYDPRVSPQAGNWTDNVPLCVADYLTNATIGFGSDYATEINEAELIAAANICDELVELNQGSPSQYEKRYTCNGAFQVSELPRDILPRLLQAMQGSAVLIGGIWTIRAGAYVTPVETYDEDDLRGPIDVVWRLSARDSYNGVKGVFVDPNSSAQPVDFPAVTNATYRSQDNDEVKWSDLRLDFTNTASMAQRIAKIELERVRQEITVTAPMKLSAYRSQPPDTLMLSNTRFGFTAKVFELKELHLVVAQDDDGDPYLGVDFSLRETASTVYDWSKGEETVLDPAPNTTLPDPYSDLDITGLTAASGTAELFVNGDGTVVPRIGLTWVAPANAFLNHYELQYALASESPTAWISMPPVSADRVIAYVQPVQDGVSYDVRMRAVTSIGTHSTTADGWAYVYGHTVAGKSALPSDVTGFSALQQGATVVFNSDSVTDADLDLIEIRLGDTGSTWGDATPITNILRGQTSTSAAVPPGSWTMLAKARDTSGNYSANAASVNLTVTADGYTTISSSEYAPAWNGAIYRLVKHWTGVLTPQSQDLASALGWEVFDEFVHNPYTDGYFTTGVIDKSIDATARIYANIVSTLGPGETTGTAAPALQVDTRLSSGSFAGFADWTIGSANFRYLMARIHVDTAVGKPVISGFNLKVDAASRSESGVLTVGGGGSGSQSFATSFHVAPVLQVTPVGSGDVTASYSSLTVSGFTGYYKTAGAAAAGDISWRATGV